MKFKLISILFLIILMINPIAGLIVEFPSSITVDKEFKDIELKVYNNSDTDKSLNIELIFPTKTELLSQASTVKAREELKVKLRIHNSEKLYNTIYSGTIKVVLGLEKLNKKIKITFKGKEEKLPKVQTEENTETQTKQLLEQKTNQKLKNESSGTTGLVSFLNISNLGLPEIVLDVILGIVAVILLIALIARIVKRLR